METVFGLPAHMLAIHAPIVLLPLAAIATVVLAVVPRWRRAAGWWMVGAIALVAVLVFLAKWSGEALDDAFDGAVDVSRHADLANATFILTLMWLVTFVALAIVGRFEAPPAAGYLLSGLTAAMAVLALVWLVRTGHEGTEVVWKATTDDLFG
jgi:preprotein translocase subunit SecG